jgi:thioredoxin 1
VASEEKFVLVDFYAEWCEPCKWVEPILDEVIGKFNGAVTLQKINIDEMPAIAQQHHVLSVPTLVLLQNDNEVWRMRGFDTAPKLFTTLKSYIE